MTHMAVTNGILPGCNYTLEVMAANSIGSSQSTKCCHGVWPCVRWRLWSVLPHLYLGGCFCPLDVITLAVSAGRALWCRVVWTVGVLRTLELLCYAAAC